MEKTYQKLRHEVDLSYQILGLGHALPQKCPQRRKHHTGEPAPRHQPKDMPLGNNRANKGIIGLTHAHARGKDNMS